MAATEKSLRRILVSNGTDFFEINSADLNAALADGFYLPEDRGLTVVSNGDEVFEVTLEDAEAAKAEGFRDLVADLAAAQRPSNRKKNRRKKSGAAAAAIAGLPIQPLVQAAAVAIQTGQENEVFLFDSIDLEGDGEPQSSIDLSELPDVQGTKPEALVCLGVEDVVDEEAEIRRQLEAEIEEATGFHKLKLLVELHCPTGEQVRSFSRSYGVSILLHVVVVIALSMMLMHVEEASGDGAIISSVVSTDDTQSEDAEEILEEVEIEEVSVAEASDPAGDISDTLGLQADGAAAFDVNSLGGGAEGLSDALAEGLETMTGPGEKTDASFFGSKQVASRFVFVIDNSLSMTKGRFETALNELAKTIMQLSPKQSYYIIFYSDTAYGLFHPQTHNDLISATPRNKALTLRWLTTVELCLKTNAAEALQMAYALSPDVIFVLGDGAFGDNPKVVRFMNGLSQEKRQITVHTLGMEVNQEAAGKLMFLSKASGGKYHNVGVHPQAAVMAQQNPRRRNNKNGPIWGIALGR